MRRHLLALIVLLSATVAGAVEITPTADLRVRQEVLDGVYHFATDADRDWLRVRTRVGVRADADRYGLELRLVNEHRHIFTPDTDFSWDEVLVDRLVWRWQPQDQLTVTVGRQDIIWPGGFLVLEGHPLDGSRTIFQDGVRLRSKLATGDLDVAVVHNRRRARLVLIDDQDRDLAFGDETGVLLRYGAGAWSGSFIVKDLAGDLSTTDLRTTTAGARYQGPLGGSARWRRRALPSTSRAVCRRPRSAAAGGVGCPGGPGVP
ncbi:MAG: hypothetical protein R3D98_11945 [Candidatus Krumholzibacteriia bacterium]